MQGSHLAGGSEESVGVGVEGAPLTLLEGVTDFLIHQRAAVRKEANALAHHGSEVAEANLGVCCKCMALAGSSLCQPCRLVTVLVEGACIALWPNGPSPLLHDSQQSLCGAKAAFLRFMSASLGDASCSCRLIIVAVKRLSAQNDAWGLSIFTVGRLLRSDWPYGVSCCVLGYHFA